MGNRILQQISSKEWYYGELSEGDGVQNGIGLKRERDSSLYFGAWKNGLRNRYGTLAEEDGSLIVGKWTEDRLTETTLRIWPVENVYAVFCGKMENGKPKEGTLIRTDGRLYHGIFTEWRGEEFDGEGALLWPDGRVYAGRWKNGGTDIGGMIRRADGRVTGTLSNVRNGYSAKSWPQDAEKQFFYGVSEDEEVRNAKGILFYTNGEFFAGEMRGGKRSGSGIWRESDASIRIGEWKNGIQHEYGMWIQWTKREISLYVGDFRDDHFDGDGCMLRRNRNDWDFSYCGSWKKGKRSGEGFCKLDNGHFFVGGFWEDQRNGRGETILPDGTRNTTNWKMGVPDILLDEIREPGPRRKLFKSTDKVSSAAFNSMEKHEEFGEEQCFVGIRADVNSPYQRTMRVESGCDYEVRIFYHNNADGTLSDEGGTAKETKLRAFYTKQIGPGQEGAVSASISAKGADPPVVWDCVKLFALEELPVRYKIASAKIQNAWKSNGHILTQALFTESGVYLGTDELNGILPPGETGTVTFTLHVGDKKKQKDASSISRTAAAARPAGKNIEESYTGEEVRGGEPRKKRKRSRVSIHVMAACGNDAYAKAVKADIGEEISVKITFTNSASDQDIRISAEFPVATEYIAGTSILNLSDGSRRKQSDNWIKEGLSLPNFMADGGGELNLKIRYFPTSGLSVSEEINVKIETADITMQNRMSISGC